MPPPDPDLTPAQEHAVRSRLADARHEGPIPDDVAARLDATLAGLVADRDGAGAADEADPGERVVRLRSRRRKVTAGLLVAATVVVVGGVVGGQILGDQVSVLPTLGGGSETSSDAGSAASEESGGDAAPAERGARQRGDRDRADGIEDPTLTHSYESQSGTLDKRATRGAPEVDPSTFAADAERLSVVSVGRGSATYSLRSEATADAKVGCSVSAGRGRRVLVTYEGQLGVLVYRRPEGGRQQVELHLCGSLAPRRTTEIPAD